MLNYRTIIIYKGICFIMDIVTKHLYRIAKNKHCWLTFCSTFAATIIVILLITHQTDVVASTSPLNSIDEFVETVGEGEFVETAIVIDPENDDSFESAHQIVGEIADEFVELKQGDTFLKVLTNIGLSYNEANNIYLATQKIYDPRRLKAGQVLQIRSRRNNDSQLVSVDNITSTIKTGERFVIERDENGKYFAQIQKDELIEEINSVSGIIDGNLSIAMNNQNIPSNIIANFINIFSYSVDFKRDIKKGDKFEIIYENYITPNGEVVKNGDIIYASITLRKNKIDLYRFKDSSGTVDYYDANGLALKKTLMKKPLSFQNARISSPFGKRRHPIHKDIRVHWGVDYAAPINTLVYAAGDGVVLTAKYNSGYGNYIKIRHNSEYSTAYGHMNKFAKGIKPGTRVKQGQVIGYVGNTGRSTGPHLHYEVIRNNKRVNPLTVKASASENLKGKNLSNFKRVVAKIQETHKNMFAKTEEEKQIASTKTPAKKNTN